MYRTPNHEGSPLEWSDLRNLNFSWASLRDGSLGYGRGAERRREWRKTDPLALRYIPRQSDGGHRATGLVSVCPAHVHPRPFPSFVASHGHGKGGGGAVSSSCWFQGPLCGLSKLDSQSLGKTCKRRGFVGVTVCMFFLYVAAAILANPHRELTEVHLPLP